MLKGGIHLDTMAKRALILGFCLVLGVSTTLGQSKPFNIGVEVGKTIPSFKLTDQTGKAQGFNSVKGSKGVVLLFFRSADW